MFKLNSTTYRRQREFRYAFERCRLSAPFSHSREGQISVRMHLQSRGSEQQSIVGKALSTDRRSVPW
jgi:hypothetical protein